MSANPARGLPEDLRDYRADDGFQILTPDAAVIAIVALGVLILLFN